MKKVFRGITNPIFVSIVILIVTSIGLQIIQIQHKNLYLGHDWVFHYNRFYDAAQQIKEGNFQYFISMYGFSQSGRIVNALYGPAFAYFNGLLILICGTWFKYQLVSNFLITFLSALSMFFLLKKNNIRITISVFLAVTYSTFNIVQGWTFNQMFNTWGSVLFPIGLLAATKFLKDDDKWKSTFLLAFSVTLSIQIHVLTSLFLVVLLAIFFIVGMCISKNRLQLLGWVTVAAIITLVMTANVWYPLFETNLENTLLPPFLNYNFEATALKVSLYMLPAHITIIVFSLFVLQFNFILFIKNSLLNRLVTILGFTIFVISTRIFPWNEIIETIPNLAIIQFPFRFLVPAIALIILGLGLSIEEILSKKRIFQSIPFFVIFLVLMVGAISQHIIASETILARWNSNSVVSEDPNTTILADNSDILRNSFHDEDDLSTALKLVVKSTPDYLPISDKKVIVDPDFHSYEEYKKTILENKINTKLSKSVEDKKLTLRWSDTISQVQTLPVFVYQRTEITLNGKKLEKSTLKTNNIGALIVQSQKGKNILTVSYKKSFIFYYMLVISVISWFVFAGAVIFRNFKY